MGSGSHCDPSDDPTKTRKKRLFTCDGSKGDWYCVCVRKTKRKGYSAAKIDGMLIVWFGIDKKIT